MYLSEKIPFQRQIFNIIENEGVSLNTEYIITGQR